jgi:hypothetical protein
MGLTSILEDGRRDFVESTSGVTADVRPRSGWSVFECIEHVIIAEERYLSWLRNGTPVEPRRDSEKELRLYAVARNRLEKRETPEPFRPVGRFQSLDAALAGFNELRDRSVQAVRELGDGLYAIEATHPRFGAMNGAEVVQLMDAHARRHAEQIREILEAAD